jgi:ribosome-binding factor A
MRATGPRRVGDAAPSSRALRVGEEMRHVLAEALARGALRDPALAGRSITVTEVRMTPDLRRATAYVMPLGGGDPAPALDGLRRAGPFLRREVGRRVRLKFVPDLAFELDATFDSAGRIDALLRGLGPHDDDGDDGPAP